MKLLRNIFKPRPILIPHYHVKRTDWQRKKDAKGEQLARECGREWSAR